MVDQVEKVAAALEEAWLARGYGEGDPWNYLARAAITAYNPNERRTEVEPTQRGDDTAAAMRAYYEAHKRDKWTPGTADSLMLGLLNIVLGEYGANPNERLTPANRDCLAKAKPGEPMFIILGRDPDGANIVRLWAQRRADAGDPDHAGPVFAIADAMDDWRAKGNLPESAPDAANYPPIGVERLREALEEAREALALGAAVPPLDQKNLDAVVKLGESIGYGALMSTASAAWRAGLGDLAGGEFCAGPCRATAEKAIAAIDAALARTSPSGLREQRK